MATSTSGCRTRCCISIRELQAIPEKPEEVHNLCRRVEELRVQLGFILESNQKNTVFWIERRGERRGARGGQHNVFLQATPITVSDILRQTLFDHLETAVLTSATLAVGGGFDYIRGRLGLEHARELIVPSHFDYPSQALLYVPPDLPDPREPQFVERASQRVRQLLEISRGRAFCLFTSYSFMNQLYERLLGELEFPMLLQGSAPKNALLEEFRMTPNAVLFATSSFWQGVDVQGEQLSCVIIDRLPFAVPNDPVVAARIKAIDERRRQCVLRVPGAERGDFAEAGIWQADSLATRSRAAVPAGQPHPEEAVRQGVSEQPAGVCADDGCPGGGEVFRGGAVRNG